MVWRTYSCLNRHCRFEFNAEGDHPPCSRCGGLRVKWVPRPVNIGRGVAARVDRDVNALVVQAGMTDYRSPKYAGDKVAISEPAPAQDGMRQFKPQGGMGWSLNIPEQAYMNNRAYCGPTGVTAKLKAGNLIDVKVPGSKQLGAGAQIEGSYNPEGGIPK